MLFLEIPEREYYDEADNRFKVIEGFSFHLEHSLVSLSKWEEKYEKPFLDTTTRTDEETLYYIECMSIEPIKPYQVSLLGDTEIGKINDYIKKKNTATWITEKKGSGKPKTNKQIITSEVIYSWMVGLQIPVEFQYWNLNRLITLIQVCQIAQEPPKKMSPAQAAAKQRELNKQRRSQLGTRG